jgi:hypothetical protein
MQLLTPFAEKPHHPTYFDGMYPEVSIVARTVPITVYAAMPMRRERDRRHGEQSDERSRHFGASR